MNSDLKHTGPTRLIEVSLSKFDVFSAPMMIVLAISYSILALKTYRSIDVKFQSTELLDPCPSLPQLWLAKQPSFGWVQMAA